MSFQAVSERLMVLQESNNQLKLLIDRLATLKFQPGSIPLDDEEGNVMSELTVEIQQTIREQEDDFELLTEEILCVDAGRPGAEGEEMQNGLVNAVKRAVKELKSHEIAFRRAQLAARRSIQEAQRLERELLLQSYALPRSSASSPLPDSRQLLQKSRSKPLTEEEKTLAVSSDVTLALRRTHDLMAAELSRSQFAHDTLKESTAALAQLSETYSTLDTMLSSSKNLLGTLLRSQKSDTWYLETAFYVLCATIAWLVWRRILYGPTWWLVWFPLKMFIKGWMGVFAAMGLTGGGVSDGVGSSSSTLATNSASILPTTTSVVHNKATREPKVLGMKPPVPNVRVGGGGRGAPMRGPNVPGAADSGHGGSVTEQVGKIIDGSRDWQGSVPQHDNTDADELAQDGTEEKPNPKKRMWEETIEHSDEGKRERDEL